MRRIAPYQSGLWLAEYLNSRCQLCFVSRSEPQYSSTSNRSKNNSLSKVRALASRLVSTGLLCPNCHEHIRWLPAPFYVDIAVGESLAIQSASYYEYPIRQAIRAFKYHEEMTKLPLLVHVLRQLPRPKGCHTANSVIIPMPTTSSRLKERGFDPVTVLSAYLSQHWQIPLWHGVQRIDNTVRQQGLTRAERLTNLNQAFILTEKTPVKRLLLFDDVATTGASLQALARTLRMPPTTGADVHHSSLFMQPHTPLHPSMSTDPNAVDYHISAYAIAHGTQR